jgi:hypothetical protein
LYPSSVTVRVIKSRRMKWTRYVACMRGMINTYRILVGKPERNNLFGDLGVNERIILKLMLNK